MAPILNRSLESLEPAAQLSILVLELLGSP
jgi:hypothetical protein